MLGKVSRSVSSDKITPAHSGLNTNAVSSQTAYNLFGVNEIRKNKQTNQNHNQRTIHPPKEETNKQNTWTPHFDCKFELH